MRKPRYRWDTESRSWVVQHEYKWLAWRCFLPSVLRPERVQLRVVSS